MSVEMWLGLIGIGGTIFGAWAYWAKRMADAKLTEATTELQEVENEGKRFDQLMLLINSMGVNLQRQIEVNQTFTLALQKTQEIDEQNYQALKSMWDRHAAEIITSTRDGRDKVLAAIEMLPLKLAEINRPVNAQVVDLLTQVVNWTKESRDGQVAIVAKVSLLEERLNTKDQQVAGLEEDNRYLKAQLTRMMVGVQDDLPMEPTAVGIDDRRHSDSDPAPPSDAPVSG